MFRLSRPSPKTLLLVAAVAAAYAIGAASAGALARPVAYFVARGEGKIRRVWRRLTVDANVKPEVEWAASAGFRLKVHARGLTFPTRIALHPNPGRGPDDPLYYVAELPGAIKVVSSNGKVASVVDGLLNFRWKPDAELGLIGLDIDRSAKYAYIALTYWDAAAGVYRNRVDRLTLSEDGRRAGVRRTLLDMRNESTVASYQIQFVSAAPDGSLFVGVGSGGTKSDAQDPDKFAGKILRMSP